MKRTSATHPLQIAEVATPAGGVIGLTFCPGKVDPRAMTGAWDRDLGADLRAVTYWGATALVTLIEDHEFELLGVPDLGEQATGLGLIWLHLPIRDVSIPGTEFELAWEDAGGRLRQMLRERQRIVVHCRGGLGRTGLVAGRLLIELGVAPQTALSQVRKARPGAVETREQERYLLGLG